MQQEKSRTAQVVTRVVGIGLAAAAALGLTSAPAQAADGIRSVQCTNDGTQFMFSSWAYPATCYEGSGDIDVYLGPWGKVSMNYQTGRYSGTLTYKEYDMDGDYEGAPEYTISFSPHQDVDGWIVPTHVHID